MPTQDDAELSGILDAQTIAVVGCSATPSKAAHRIPKYMQSHGYEIVPVNPFEDEILGERAYDSLSEVEADVDIVDVFRPSDEVAGIVEEALERDDAGVIWLQQGITDDDAAANAEAAGRQFVQDRCLKVEHQRLKA